MRKLSWFLAISLALILSPIKSFALVSQTATSVYTNYGSTTLTTTPLTLIASVTKPSSSFQVFDSSGQTIVLTVTSGVYTTIVNIPPGGSEYPVGFSQGDKVTIQTQTGSISSGVDILTVLY